MPYKDLHSSPFAVSTITKLEVFEDYAQAWLPTFIMQPAFKEMHIFDFFAGPGYDVGGVLGSPMRLLFRVKDYEKDIINQNKRIVLHFNEYEPNKTKNQEKFNLLQQNCQEFIDQYPELAKNIEIKLYNEDASTLFFKLLSAMKAHPSLVYLDQNGVKFISQQFFTELEKLTTVDFLYFVSSSYFWRLGHTPEFQKVLPLDMSQVKRGKYSDVHRIVSGALKNTLPTSSTLKLFPFSIRKDANIYGIIFGAKHYRAVGKFLTIAWQRNETNGEADFDIDGEMVRESVQLDIFAVAEPPKLTKVELFKGDIKRLVLATDLTDNEHVLHYTYEAGHLPRHASDVLKELKKQGKVQYEDGSPGISYKTVYTDKKIIKYTVNGAVKY